MDKRRIMQTTPHDSPGTLVFRYRRSQQNSTRVTPPPPNGCAKCRWDRLNAGVVPANWQLSTRNILNLARLSVYHTERPPCLFAARLPWCSASRGFVSDSWSLLAHRGQWSAVRDILYCYSDWAVYFAVPNPPVNCTYRHTVAVSVGYCLPPDTLKNICTQIHVESTLYTLVRGDVDSPV